MYVELKRTPLYERHVALGGRMVDFGGWELPVQYAGILKEHEKVLRFGRGFSVRNGRFYREDSYFRFSDE